MILLSALNLSIALLPYTRVRSLTMKIAKRKRTIAKSRVTPGIYVRVKNASDYEPFSYAKAKVRIRGGEYQYLQWREAGKVRSLYLGRKRKS
jgi:hypothetical protein